MTSTTGNANPRSSDTPARVLNTCTSSGELRFVLERLESGLFIEVDDIPRRGTRTSHLMHFDSAADFERWWHSAPLRFEQPLAHVAVMRLASELWSCHVPSH